MYKRQVEGFKLFVKESQIVVPDFVGNLINRHVGIGQIETGLIHALLDDQFFEGMSNRLFDIVAQVIGMESKMLRGILKRSGQVCLLYTSISC